MFSPSMNQDARHVAAFVHVSLPGGLAMNQRQFVGESRHGRDGHAVRDEHDGHAALSRRQIERDAVRVAVV